MSLQIAWVLQVCTLTRTALPVHQYPHSERVLHGPKHADAHGSDRGDICGVERHSASFQFNPRWLALLIAQLISAAGVYATKGVGIDFAILGHERVITAGVHKKSEERTIALVGQVLPP